MMLIVCVFYVPFLRLNSFVHIQITFSQYMSIPIGKQLKFILTLSSVRFLNSDKVKQYFKSKGLLIVGVKGLPVYPMYMVDFDLTEVVDPYISDMANYSFMTPGIKRNNLTQISLKSVFEKFTSVQGFQKVG